MNFIALKKTPPPYDTMSNPRLAVIGLGQYYKKLARGIRTLFTPVAEIDEIEAVAAGAGLFTLVKSASPDAIMVLTPNQLHASQALALADLHVPILVEKPLVTTLDDLNSLIQSASINPSLYCSDFYLDVRAVPLLAWFNASYPEVIGQKIRIESDPDHLWEKGPGAIGCIVRVEAVLREGEGNAGTFAGREWLWDNVHGGVLWDLAYHYLVLWHGLIADPASLVSWEARPSSLAGSLRTAEIEATLNLRSSSGVPICIRVAKYTQQPNERWLSIEGSTGVARMTFADPNTFEIRSGSRKCVVSLVGNYYDHVVEAFRQYVDSCPNSPHGLYEAEAAVRLIASVKSMMNAS